ncbi:MAG: PAS domain S-box protein [Flavobacteriales bacterium]|nr:PAS domain S-box protein [Flavobacteriales bacterium]
MEKTKTSYDELVAEIELLRRREEGISMVLDNINEMFYKISFDDKGNKSIDYVSPQVENVLGITTYDYANHPNLIIEHFHPEEIDKLIEESKKIKKGTENWSATYRFYHKKKKNYVWIEENIITVFDPKGKKKFLFGTARDVTQKINQQRQLEFILENIEYCIYNVKFSEKGKTLNYISNTVKNITGLTAEEFTKEGTSGQLINRIHPDDIDMINDHINNGLYVEKKKKIHTEFRFKPKGKKQYCWIEETVYANYNKSGDIIETTTVLRDITQNKETALKLEESEFLYKTFSNLSNEVVLIHDQGIVKEINNSIYKVMGYKPEELLNKSIISLATEESVKVIQKNIATSYTKPYEVEGYKKNGEKIYMLVTGKPINWKGEKLRAVTMLDITERKIIENHLKESEEKYRNIFSKNMAGVFITENDKIIECNNAFAKIFGYKSRVELIGKSSFTIYFNKKDREEYIADLNKKGYLANYRIRHKKKDGSELWILTNVTKKENRIEGTLIEITDEIRKEELDKEKLRAQIAEESNKILQKEIEERKKIERKLIENQKYTNSIIDSSLDIICASDNTGKIIEINNAGLSVFGFEESEIYKYKSKVFYANTEEFLKVSRQLKKTGTYIGEVKNKRKNGEVFTCFLSASLLHDEEGNIIGSMGVSRDITELKEAEQQLIDSEEKYRDLFENATDLIQSVDINGNILYVNEAWKKTLGYTDEEIENKNVFDFIHSDCKNKCDALFSEILGEQPNKSKKISYELRSKKNEKIIVEGNVSLKYHEGKPHSTRAILRNVTEEQWEKTKQTVYNNVAKIISEKVNAEEIYESIRKELGKIINTDIFSISYVVNKDTVDFTYYYDVTRKGRIYPEKRYKKHGLNEYYIKLGKSKILYKEDWNKIIDSGKYQLYGPEAEVFIGVPLKIKNKVIGVLAVQSYDDKHAYDKRAVEILEFISSALAQTVQRKYDEEELKNSLKEKEVLLKEVHHRVKNNLQVISSILNLQSSYVKDENTLDILKESQNRIKSMSFIHESLYQNNDFSQINFSEYVISLSKNLVHSYGVYDNLVELKLDVQEVSLNLDQSIPCGLLINELISNALKYAFPKGKRGVITIELFEKSGKVYLAVKDNGVGLPKNIDYRNTDSLGLQLVMTLTEQLNAKIELDNSKGAKYYIEIKKEQ